MWARAGGDVHTGVQPALGTAGRLPYITMMLIVSCMNSTKVSPQARVLVTETVVPPTPEPHLSKELDIIMMAIPGGMERTREEYARLGSNLKLRLQRVVEMMSPYSILEFVVA